MAVGLGKEGEKIERLDDEECTLQSQEVVIRKGRKELGVGGVMGGGDCEVRNERVNVVIECA